MRQRIIEPIVNPQIQRRAVSQFVKNFTYSRASSRGVGCLKKVGGKSAHCKGVIAFKRPAFAGTKVALFSNDDIPNA